MTPSAARRMLPLSSSARTIDTGLVASWKASTVCGTPSSITTRSSRVTSRTRRLSSTAVNSSVGRTGGGFGAK